MMACTALFDIILLCARFNWFLDPEGGAQYKPFICSNGLNYFSPAYFDATSPSLIQAGCPANAHDCHSPAADSCDFIFKLELELLSQVYVKCCMGVGIIFVIVFRVLKGSVDLGGFPCNLLTTMQCTYFKFVLNALLIQHYMLLFPLQAILPTQYCLLVDVPQGIDVKQAVCLFKVLAVAIIIGPVMLIAGIIAIEVGMKIYNGHNYLGIVILVLPGICVSAIGILFIAYWLLGGTGLGMWFMAAGTLKGFGPSITATIIFSMSLGLAMLCYFNKLISQQEDDFDAVEMNDLY